MAGELPQSPDKKGLLQGLRKWTETKIGKTATTLGISLTGAGMLAGCERGADAAATQPTQETSASATAGTAEKDGDVPELKQEKLVLVDDGKNEAGFRNTHEVTVNVFGDTKRTERITSRLSPDTLAKASPDQLRGLFTLQEGDYAQNGSEHERFVSYAQAKVAQYGAFLNACNPILKSADVSNSVTERKACLDRFKGVVPLITPDPLNEKNTMNLLYLPIIRQTSGIDTDYKLVTSLTDKFEDNGDGTAQIQFVVQEADKDIQKKWLNEFGPQGDGSDNRHQNVSTIKIIVPKDLYS